jgi:alkanesulfonate monooxygenase SsuD/methylene tetrahydromethanopterin reductase-like flavin-dependent oxidoreductase (luciferase family)
VKLVLHVSDFGWPVPTSELTPLLGELAETAESAGFDGIGVADHLWQHPIMGGPERPQLEAYTTLGLLVAHTDAIRLMTVATGAHFRRPALLAKIVTTLRPRARRGSSVTGPSSSAGKA